MEKIKEEIAYFMRRLYQQRLTTTSGGNISARLGDLVLITPSGTDKGRLTAADIGVMNLQGEMMGEHFKPSIESRMHLGIYQARPDISAIVHAHPSAASTFAASTAVLNTHLLAESYVILGEVATVGYHCIGSEALAAETAECISGGSNCALMLNHGALTVGKSLLEAFDRLEVMEVCAQINLNIYGPLSGKASELCGQSLRDLDNLIGRKGVENC